MSIERSQCDLPAYYLYKADDGQWHRTKEEMTTALNRLTIRKTPLAITRDYFPQWPAPEFLSETRPAWYIRADGVRLVRTYRRRCHHNRTHGGQTCKMINDKECARTCAIMLQWDEKSKLWVQTPLIDKLEDK